MMIDYHDAIFPFISSLHRADLGTGRVIAMITHQYNRFFRFLAAAYIFNLHFPDPVNIPPVITMKRNIVFLPAGIQTGGAIGTTFCQIYQHTPALAGRGYIADQFTDTGRG
jgi:hypothetical protein